MAKSTKNTYKTSKTGNYKPVVRMENGGNVSELNYSERSEYIEENYAPFITDAQMIFSIYGSSIEYDYKANRKEVVNKIIEEYQSLGDYSEKTLPLETIYEIQDWDLVRREIDPDTDEVIGETSLEEVSADNTYNFSYLGLVDLNWRVYHDEEYDRFFYVIMPHLGGDIRGNYGEAIILEGDDKEELFYRFYENFISGNASVYLKFTDGSEIAFDSEQDSDVFTFRVSEISELTGMAEKYSNDFEKFDSWKGDEFVEETVDIYLMRQGIAPKMMAGGKLNDETPKAYIQILGYDEGKWMTITDYTNGEDVIDAISDYMKELNKQFGGNREEYEVADYEGFGDDLFDQYMGANEFDEIIDGYEKYQNSDFPADVITAYKNDSGSTNDSLSNVIDEMDNNFFGKYNNFSDFGYEMVEQGVYELSDRDIYVTDTDKRILAGEEADEVVDNMLFDDLLDKAQDVKSEYEDEKSELEDKISTIQSEIDDLSELQKDSENDDEYEKMSELIIEKEIELDDTQYELDDIDSRYEDKAREEAQELFYDEIYDKLENDLSSWLEEYGYTDDLQNLHFISVDYEQIGNEIASDYLMVDFDGEIYFFNNYKKGGRITASKRKPKYAYYIVESSTKKLVSGYDTKAEATEQRKLLVQQYPAMRFEIYPLANLESKTNLDVYAKKDYVELSTLDKIKKVSVDAYRYGQEKVGQANLFLEKHDVKGKINRGARKVADKTKQGASWLRNQWREADFGDGTGKAKFFADGGGVGEFESFKDYVRVREHLFFIVDKNGKRLEDWATSGDNILRHQEDWDGEDNLSSEDVVTESILKANGVNPNDVVSIVVYDLTKGEQIFNGSQLSDKEWYDYIKILKEDTYEEYANGGEIYDISLPIGFYVKINPNYTATIRNLKSFESYLERKDEIFGKEFGEITYVDKSANKEWVAELKRLISKKKSELETNGTSNYKVGEGITIWRNQADRDGYVIAVDNNEILVEYEMPNGTTALNIIDTTLPEYDKKNDKKNYIPISYDNAKKSKKWSSKIDANRLINNPQGSSRNKLPTKRFDNGGEDELFRPTKKQKDEMKNTPFNPNISMENHEVVSALGIDKTEYSPKIMNVGRWVDISNRQGTAYMLPFKIISLQKNYKNEIIYRGANQLNVFGTPISEKDIKKWLTENEALKMYNDNIGYYIDSAYDYGDGGGVHTMPNGEVMLNSAHYENGGGVDAIFESYTHQKIDEKKILRFRNKLVTMNIGKNNSALDFVINVIDSIVSGKLVPAKLQAPNEMSLFEIKAEEMTEELIKINLSYRKGKDATLNFAISLLNSISDGEWVENKIKFANGGRIEKVFVAQTDGILGIYSGSDAYSIEISKGDKFITFGNQDDNNWWYVKMLDDQPKTMMENNTFDYNKNKSRVNLKPNDLILTFPRGDKSIYAEMKEVFADGGVSYEPMTKPVPTTKPKERTRPDKDNPYKPKGIPRPKSTIV